MSEPVAAQPRLGAFLTMTVGLLLFFGFISRIHELPGPMLAASRPQPQPDPQTQVDEIRQHTQVVFGTSEDALPDTRPLEQQVQELPLEEMLPPSQEPSRVAPDPEPAPAPAPAPRRTEPQHSRKRYYAIQSGDTLWKIAQREYGNGALHYLIQQANPWIDPSSLPVGFELLIPPLEAGQPSMAR